MNGINYDLVGVVCAHNWPQRTSVDSGSPTTCGHSRGSCSPDPAPTRTGGSDLFPTLLLELFTPHRCLLTLPSPAALRPAQQPRRPRTGRREASERALSRHRLGGSPPLFPRGRRPRAGTAERREGRGGPCVALASALARGRSAISSLPFPTVRLPGSAAASASVGPRCRLRLVGLRPSAPGCPSALVGDASGPRFLDAGLARGLSSGILSAPPAPGPPPMGPG